MSPHLIFLFLAPPALTLLYAVLEHFKVLDRWFGRDHAIEGLERLRSGSGFPKSWIFDDAQDKACFVQLEKRISKMTRSKTIKAILSKGVRPSLITVAGQPVLLTGVPANWETTDKLIYLSGHPVLYTFGVTRSGGEGKADRACSLGELEKWLNDEKERRKFFLGAVALGIISITFIVLRVVGGK
jgi:hypothetical protein